MKEEKNKYKVLEEFLASKNIRCDIVDEGEGIIKLYVWLSTLTIKYKLPENKSCNSIKCFKEFVRSLVKDLSKTINILERAKPKPHREG